MIVNQTIRTELKASSTASAEVVKTISNDLTEDLDEYKAGSVVVAGSGGTQTVNIAAINTPSFLLISSDIAVDVQIASAITLEGITVLTLTGTFDRLVFTNDGASEATVYFLAAGAKT